MKKISLCAAAFILSASLLAGCSSFNDETPSGEETPSIDNLIFDDIAVDEALQAEFEEMLDRNFLPSVFDTYVIVGFEAEGWVYESGEKVPQYTLRYSFSSAGSGTMYQGEEEWDGVVLGHATYNDDVNPFAVATSYPDYDSFDLDVYPAGEYEATIVKQWLVFDDDGEQEERVVSITVDEEADSKVFVTRTIREDLGVEVENTFFVDAETGYITDFQQVGYDLESGEISLSTDVSLTYNEPFEFASDPVSDVFGGENLCKVTVVFNPGQDSEEIQTYSVVEGTYVNIVTSGQFEMYSNAECTEPCDLVDTFGDEVTVYVKLIG